MHSNCWHYRSFWWCWGQISIWVHFGFGNPNFDFHHFSVVSILLLESNQSCSNEHSSVLWSTCSKFQEGFLCCHQCCHCCHCCCSDVPHWCCCWNCLCCSCLCCSWTLNWCCWHS